MYWELRFEQKHQCFISRDCLCLHGKQSSCPLQLWLVPELIEAKWRRYASVNKPSLVQIMAFHLVVARPFSESLLSIISWNEPKWWNLNQNTNIFIQVNEIGNVVCKIAAILPRHQCVEANPLHSWQRDVVTDRALIKMSSYQYRKSHCGDKTTLRPSYLHNVFSYIGKMTSLYWNGAQVPSSWWMNTMRLRHLYT